MSDPLSFVPLALAAADGNVDGIPCRQLVASGVALLQRTAPLVRALDGRQAAILLPMGPAFLVALAACSGRAASILEPGDDGDSSVVARRSREVGGAFTLRSLAHQLPPTLPRVLLDASPARAEWLAGGETRSIDLSLHAGLLLEGDPETEGSDEPALMVDDGSLASAGGTRLLTHRALLDAARATMRAQRMDHRAHSLTPGAPVALAAVVDGFVAPLLAGGRVSTADGRDVATIIARLERDAVTSLVATAALYTAIADACLARGRALDAPLLQHCMVGHTSLDPALADRWRGVSAVPLAPLRSLDAVASAGDRHSAA